MLMPSPARLHARLQALAEMVDSIRTRQCNEVRTQHLLKAVLGDAAASEVEESGDLKPWEEQDMNDEDATKYRAVVVRCNFLSIDRPDLIYASKECSRQMCGSEKRAWKNKTPRHRHLVVAAGGER